jgi:hypothetical protein
MQFKKILFVALQATFLNTAWGQTASGVITGVVSDASGAAVASAKVTLLDQETNQSREQSTNTSGVYEFRALPRGLYTLQTELVGFKKGEIKNLQLTVAQTIQLDIKLELGQTTE